MEQNIRESGISVIGSALNRAQFRSHANQATQIVFDGAILSGYTFGETTPAVTLKIKENTIISIHNLKL